MPLQPQAGAGRNGARLAQESVTVLLPALIPIALDVFGRDLRRLAHRHGFEVGATCITVTAADGLPVGAWDVVQVVTMLPRAPESR